MYKSLYDKDHKFYALVINDPVIKQESFFQEYRSGIHEAGLLCKVCDNQRLNTFENYMRTFLLGGNNLPKGKKPTTTYLDNDIMRMNHIDYSKIKLFILSILWRMSISSRPEFHDFSIRNHEEILRETILKEMPKDDGLYPIIIMRFRSIESLSNLIINPKIVELKTGVTIAILPIDGTVYLIGLGELTDSYPNDFSTYRLRESNEMYILPIKNAEDFVTRYLSQII